MLRHSITAALLIAIATATPFVSVSRARPPDPEPVDLSLCYPDPEYGQEHHREFPGGDCYVPGRGSTPFVPRASRRAIRERLRFIEQRIRSAEKLITDPDLRRTLEEEVIEPFLEIKRRRGRPSGR